MQKLLKVAARYADVAIEKGTRKASAMFMRDYVSGKYTLGEHLTLMMLVQAYIDCKLGYISREECLRKQKEILK